MEPVVHQAQTHGFGEGWLTALQAMAVAKDSPLRNLKQILYPAPVLLVQSQANAADEEETLSMRELVHAIDTHVEMVDLEVTSNLHAVEEGQGQSLAADLPVGSVPVHQADEVIQAPTAEPSA